MAVRLVVLLPLLVQQAAQSRAEEAPQRPQSHHQQSRTGPPAAPSWGLGVTQLIRRPGYHFWPRTVQSQDISGPIGLVDPATNATTWHVFVDCSVEFVGVGGSNLAWCHFISEDLVAWREVPVAMHHGPPGSPDDTGLNTGSVFQHPNGTVCEQRPVVSSCPPPRLRRTASHSHAAGACLRDTDAVYDMCDKVYNRSLHRPMEGDICFARAKDHQLLEWDKLCYAADSAATGGRLLNPVCQWCTTCPERCQNEPHSLRNDTIFPDILQMQQFRDPPAPWLAPCNSSTSDQCWWQGVASGVVNKQPALLMYKNDMAMSQQWELAVPGGMVNSKSVWFGNGHAGHPYSCPDIFEPPQEATGRPLAVFTSLYDNYVLGRLNPATQLFEAIPPFSQSSSLPLGASAGTQLSIAKTGGIGASNVNSGSRRLYFGTITQVRVCSPPV
jgi:hypothetical protein